MYTLGIDIGSTTSKCVVLRDGTEIVARSLQIGGHLMASVFCPCFRPAMATVRPGVMKKHECKKDVEILHPVFNLSAEAIKTAK